MSSLASIAIALAALVRMALAISVDTKHRDEVLHTVKVEDVVRTEGYLMTLAAPVRHSPWAYWLGLSDHTTPVLELAQIGIFRESQNITFAQGMVLARGHAAAKTVVAEIDGSMLKAYMCSLFIVASVITFIYWGEGISVIGGILAYLLALSTMKIVVKWVFKVQDFQYPIFLTGTHMLSSALVGFALLLYRSWKNGEDLVVPTARELGFKLTPLAACIAGSIGAGNIALVFCSASFAEIVASSGPIVTVAMILIMGMPFNYKLLLPTCVVVAGCSLSVVGEVNFSMTGFVLCFVANIGRAMKVVLQQELMTGPTKAKFDPVATLAWMCTCSFCIIIIWSFVSEGAAPFARFLTPSGRWSLVAAILASCVNAVILNLAALFVTKNLGAVGAQLVAQVKSVLTVLGGMVVFQEELSRQEFVGFAFVLVGTYAYSRTEQMSKKAEPAREQPVAASSKA